MKVRKCESKWNRSKPGLFAARPDDAAPTVTSKVPRACHEIAVRLHERSEAALQRLVEALAGAMIAGAEALARLWRGTCKIHYLAQKRRQAYQ